MDNSIILDKLAESLTRWRGGKVPTTLFSRAIHLAEKIANCQSHIQPKNNNMINE